MNRWITSWLFALRIARRQVLRDKARNTLIVAMLMLPVFGAVAVDTLITSATDLSTAEQLARTVGGFDAFVYPSQGSAIYQTPGVPPESVPANANAGGSATSSATAQPSQTASASASSLSAISLLLPHARFSPEQTSGSVYFDSRGAYASGSYGQVDLGDPATRGVFDLVSGRMPAAADEIVLSPAMAGELGAQVGAPVTLEAGSAAAHQPAQFTVVGLVEVPDLTKAAMAFALPSAPAAAGETVNGWFAADPGGVSWSQVQSLNRLGVEVVSRAVVLDPPAAAQVPFYTAPAASQNQVMGLSTSGDLAPAAVLSIVLGVALLEIVLLAGPAFAVSARRREREYAMLGAAGADARQLRRIVLADGVVLGVVAGVVGIGLGYGVAAALLPWASRVDGRLPGTVHVSIPQAGGVALIAVLLGLCSALFPARAVARREIMATLAGRRTDQIGRRRRVASVCWGAALIGAGLLFQHFGTGATGAAPLPLVGGTSLPVVGGIALVEVGAIMCTSSIVAAVASLGRLLPLGPRLALRESARHSGRTTPAVAAMFAAVAGAVAAGAWLDSSAAQQRAQYTPLLLPNQVAIQTDPATAAKIVSALKPLLPNMTGTLVTESVAGYQQSINASPLWTVDAFAPGSGAPACAADGVTKVAVADLGNTSCGNYISPTAGEGELIGGPQVFQTVTGIDDAAATRVLEQGGIVVTDPSLVHDGTTSVVVQCAVYAPHAAEATQTTLTLTLPAVYVDAHGKPDPGFVVSPAAADRLGLAVPAGQQTTLVIDLSQPVTARQMYLSNELVQHQFDGSLQVDYGPSDTRDLANLAVLGFTILLAICAAAIATGLALADGRADQETLTAVGGSPWTRRWLAGSTALVITGLGVLIGVPVGFVIAGGLVDVSNVNLEGQSMPFTVPWLNLGAMVLAVPLLTAAGAMALSRTKAPAIRRLG